MFLFPLLLFVLFFLILGAYAKMQTWEQDADVVVLGGSWQDGDIVLCGGLIRLELEVLISYV